MEEKNLAEMQVELAIKGLKLRTLQLQMGNHLVFNALQSIQGFVLMHNEEELLHYISVLSAAIRHTLETVSEELIPLAKELEYLRKYAEIEKLRHGDQLKVNFHIKVDDTRVMVPPMLIQPLIENSIKRGLLGKLEGGTIDIVFTQTDNLLQVEVVDDGLGRAAWGRAMDHLDKGLEILKERLDLINERSSPKHNRIEIRDRNQGNGITGTRMILTLVV